PGTAGIDTPPSFARLSRSAPQQAGGSGVHHLCQPGAGFLMRALRLLAMVFAAVVALLVLAFGYLQTAPGQRLLADLVSGTSLKVSGLGGFFPTDLQVARVELLDTQGPWLVVENPRLPWSFAWLFGGRVRVDLLSASRIDVQRPPVPDKTEDKTAGGTFSALPIGVDVQAVSIDTLHLTQPVANIDSSWR